MKHWLSLIGLTAALFAFPLEQSAAEYRKCNVRILVVAEGMPETEVAGARFWAWGRDAHASGAWERINATARACASKLYGIDYSSLPQECAAHETFLKDGISSWSGITGLATSRVHSLMKKTLCTKYPRPNDRVRTLFDTREVSGLWVNIRPVGNSKACKSKTIIGPKHFILHCRRDGTDTVGEWFYSP